MQDVSFNDRIKLWRLFRGLTQEELAEKSGISRPNLVVLERGRRECTLSTLNRLAHALGVTPGTLLDRIPDAGTAGPDRYKIDLLARAVLSGRRVHQADDLDLVRQAVHEAGPLLRVAGVRRIPRAKRVELQSRDAVMRIVERIRKLVPFVLRGGKL